jgi:RNA polymerase sigma-70 factor (ECF subfamily)
MSDSIVEESELINQIKEGSRAAFEILVNQYREKAFALAFSIVGNVEDAKDITQEAFIRVYNSIKQFREEASFSTWFYRILVNLSKDRLRKNKYTKYSLSEPIAKNVEGGKEIFIEIKDLDYSPKRLALNKELDRMIDLAISELPEKQRLTFVLKHIEGMKIDQIAKILNCAQATVKVNLFKAVRNLRKELQPYIKEAE